MTIMISKLPEDSLEEILSRVPKASLGAVRSTCKRWNGLSKDRVLWKGEAREQFYAFMIKGSKMCSMDFDLYGILSQDAVFVKAPPIKQVEEFNEVGMLHAFHCDGLMLLVMEEIMRKNFRLVVWNPYLGKIWLVKLRNSYHVSDMYILGYDNNHRNNKILRRYLQSYEIYDFRSSSWRVLDAIPECNRNFGKSSVSLKGNTYFFQHREKIGEGPAGGCLLCFDFTRERFGPRLPLPFEATCRFYTVALSSVGEEQLAVCYNNWDKPELEVWVTTKIEPNAVSWSKFLKFTDLKCRISVGFFFIDQEKKLAVIFNSSFSEENVGDIAHIKGETTGHLRIVDLIVTTEMFPHIPMCSYAPSLVQINQGQELSLIFYSSLFVSFIIFFTFIYFVFF